ncbi:MAG: hypothetical protein CLLPBCKN_007875 [Chroococcidiopsis cubana SAG 39.79]|nr:hypothetical protein [Chroococcidiopsis cubana]MDZ4878440.1 hypothetical protein [Chroococcidiopsis cubana SAG 39.79]
MTQDMQREFTSREELVAYLKEQFPTAASRDDNISETVGDAKLLKSFTNSRSGRLRQNSQLSHGCGNSSLTLSSLWSFESR